MLDTIETKTSPEFICAVNHELHGGKKLEKIEIVVDLQSSYVIRALVSSAERSKQVIEWTFYKSNKWFLVGLRIDVWSLEILLNWVKN